MGHPPAITSAEAQRQYLPGRLTHLGNGPAWKDILVEIYSRNPVERRILVPAVAEPQIVWQISGTVLCEEREPGGEWSAHTAGPGEMFLTASSTPYELRWHAVDHEPLVVMQLFVGLPLLAAAAREVLGEGAGLPALKDAYAIRDRTLNCLLEPLRSELMERGAASQLLVQGIAHGLAVHLVRNYRDESLGGLPARLNVLPAFRFRKVESHMLENLETGVQIGELARLAEMSESHFSRLFKNTTGLSPMRYFIRLRMAKARRMLRETRRSIIEIGLEAGYASPSHFAQVFRKETGRTPNEYRQSDAARF